MQNNTPETPVAPETGKTKKRHGCLLVYLVFLICVAAGVTIYYIADESSLRSTLNVPGWTIPVLVVLGILEIICAVALFRWKKWGFWVFCVLAIISVIINLASGLGIGSSLAGLIGIAIMYGVLNIGDKENKGWPQLD